MMKLSMAIRLGAMLHPQTHGLLRTKTTSGETLATCAIGAADEAIGTTSDGFQRLVARMQQWPWLYRFSEYSCPATCGPRVWSQAEGLLAHLNDTHHWTREGIADFVETVEPPETSEAEDVMAVAHGESRLVR